jgi:tetratricopeptide (TPR) repeat protein
MLNEEPGNDLAAIHSILGFVLVSLGRLDEAINHYDACLGSLHSVLVPDALELADAHFNLALIHAAVKDHEQSDHHLREAATLMDSLSQGAKERDEHFRKVFLSWFEDCKKLEVSELPKVLLLKQLNSR